MALPTKVNLVTELYYSGAWHVVPVYTRDSCSIDGAVPNFSAVSSPARAIVSIQNKSGAYSPLNPSSALYGLIGPNTPIRITADGEILFVGEIETWVQRASTKAGVDAWVIVTAYGITWRINRPGVQAPELSALRRAYRPTGTLSAGLLAYYSLEEQADADAPLSGVVGGAPLVLSNAVTMGAVRDPQNGSLSYAQLDGSVATPLTPAFLDVALPASTAGFASFAGVFKATMPRPSVARAVIYQASRVYFATGAITDAQIIVYAKWTGLAFDGANTGVDVVLTGGTSFGSVVGGAVAANLFDGQPHDVQWRMFQSGADVIGQLWIDGVLADTKTSAGKTLGAQSILVGPYVSTGSLGGTATDPIDTTFGFGHYAVNSSSNAVVPHAAAIGHVSEPAGTRINRLYTEDGLPITIVGDAAATQHMGPQIPASLLTLTGHCLEVGGGVLFDTKAALSVTYRTQADLYNQSPAVALTYDAGDQIAPPLDPTDDTEPILNDVTVRRFQGGIDRVERSTGPRNVSEPTADPQGVGRYPRSFTLYLERDAQTTQQAARRVAVGTYVGARYPVVTLDLTAMVNAGLTALKAQVAALGVGDRFTVANTPASSGPDGADQIYMGYAHQIDSHHWTLTANAVPAQPYEAWELETGSDNRARVPAGVSYLNDAASSTATGLLVASPNVPWIDTATYPAMFPFDVTVAGERARVSAITNNAAAYVGTSAASAHAVNASVTPALPVGVAAGHLMLIHAAIRNVGGVPVAPAGYVRLPFFGAGDNEQVFARYNVASDTAPTVTFTGGIANADTSARMAAFSNVPRMTSIADLLIASGTQLNAAAADAAYPGLATSRRTGAIALYFAWKQSLVGSFATPAGFVEIAESLTALGDDQSFVWGYRLDTAPAAIDPGAVIVTGGGTNITRTAVGYLRGGTQTMTAARSVNNVVKALPAGAAVQLYKPPALAM